MHWGDTKVCNLKGKTWVKIYLTIQALLIILIIGELSTPNWVYLDFDTKFRFNSEKGEFDASSFKGGLLTCYDGCDSVRTYRSFYDKYCDSSSYSDDDYYDDYYDYSDSYSTGTSSVCNMMDDLASIGPVKLGLDIFVIALIGAWSGTMFCFKHRPKLRGLNLLFAIMSMMISISSTINWIIRSGSTSSDCGGSSFSSFNSVCMGDGPRLAIAIMVMHCVSVIVYSCIARAMSYKQVMKQFEKAQEHMHSGIVTVGVPQPFAVAPQGVPGMIQPVVFTQPIIYQQGMPQPGYPQTGYPQPGYPQPGYPQTGFPQPSYPQQGLVHGGITPQGLQVTELNPVNTSYNHNLDGSMNIKGSLNDETHLGPDKN